jgi:hypothetical protein
VGECTAPYVPYPGRLQYAEGVLQRRLYAPQRRRLRGFVRALRARLREETEERRENCEW